MTEQELRDAVSQWLVQALAVAADDASFAAAETSAEELKAEMRRHGFDDEQIHTLLFDGYNHLVHVRTGTPLVPEYSMAQMTATLARIAETGEQQIATVRELGAVMRQHRERLMSALSPEERADVERLVENGECWLDAIEKVTPSESSER